MCLILAIFLSLLHLIKFTFLFILQPNKHTLGEHAQCGTNTCADLFAHWQIEYQPVWIYTLQNTPPTCFYACIHLLRVQRGASEVKGIAEMQINHHF